MKLDGRVALITGSGRNIGRAIALDMAREGANVVINARSNTAEAESVAREAEEVGVKALVTMADVSDKAQVDRMFQRALETFGRVDILVSNVAIRPHKPFLEVTLEDWRQTVAVILDGAFYCTTAALPSMVANKWGRIIYIAGDGAFVGTPMMAHISAPKMGLVGLARSLASEFAPNNVTVNVISPGRIDTSRNLSWYPDANPSRTEGLPLGRLGQTSEIAAACLFLASDGGAYTTGQTLHINGGWDYF